MKEGGRKIEGGREIQKEEEGEREGERASRQGRDFVG